MKSAFAAILLCWSVQDAAAFQRPKDKDLAEIREQLDAANDKTLDRAQRNDAREKALWLTIRAYDILSFQYGGPVFPTRTSVLRSPQNGKKISFIPVVAAVGSYAIQNEIGRRRGTETLGIEESGNFASDGVARIFPSAFSNPSALASTILHELMHFRQATTPGVGDVLTPGEFEVEAYDAQLADTEAGFFPFTDVELDAEKAYLKKNLKKKKAQAVKERAQVNRSRGVPIDGYSVASLRADAIKELADKARRQVQIANKDHDARLRITLLDIALRSCDGPGTISQSELNGIPQPHSPFFANDAPRPEGLEECAQVYDYLAGGGRDNAELRRVSVRPAVPAEIRPYVPPAPATPAAPLNIQFPFSGSLPRFKDYAVAACGTLDKVPVNTRLTLPSYPYRFESDRDTLIVNELSANLGQCERQLFGLLIDYIRSGRGSEITAEWSQAAAARFRPAPAYQPPYYDPCRANGNKNCPPLEH